MKKLRLGVAASSGVLVLVLAACNGILGIPSDVDDSLSNDAATAGESTTNGSDAIASADVQAGPDADAGRDSSADADADAATLFDAGPLCDITKDFLAPTLLASISKTGTEGSARLSDDELTLNFSAQLNGDPYSSLYTATRSVLTDSFFGITLIPGGVNDPNNYEFQPNLTTNGLAIFFERQNPISEDSDLYTATRSAKSAPFGTATLIPDVNSMPGYDAKIFMRGNGTRFYYTKGNVGQGGRADILLAEQSGADWVTTVLPVINQPTSNQYSPVISADGLTLFFSSDRPSGGPLGYNVWVATRALATDDFGPPALVPNVNSDSFDEPSWLSVDGCRLYLNTQRLAGGKMGIFVAKRPL